MTRPILTTTTAFAPATLNKVERLLEILDTFHFREDALTKLTGSPPMVTVDLGAQQPLKALLEIEQAEAILSHRRTRRPQSCGACPPMFTSQAMPNLSMSIPNESPHGALARGIVSVPPTLSLS